MWLLGLAYHRKLVVGPHDSESGSPVGNKVWWANFKWQIVFQDNRQVTTFAETDSGIEAFEADYKSKVWLQQQSPSEAIGILVYDNNCHCHHLSVVDVVPSKLWRSPRHIDNLRLWVSGWSSCRVVPQPTCCCQMGTLSSHRLLVLVKKSYWLNLEGGDVCWGLVRWCWPRLVKINTNTWDLILRKKLGTKITHHNRLSSDLERELFRRLFFTGWGGTGGEKQTIMYGFPSNTTLDEVKSIVYI